MAFAVLPRPIIVGQDQSPEDFFTRLRCLSPGWDGRIAFDTETTGVNIVKDVPLFASASDGVDRWLLTLEHLMCPAFQELVEDPSRVWVAANAKFDMHMCANAGLPEFAGTIVDVIVQCALRDENRKNGVGLGLKEQARDYLDIKMRPFKEVFDVTVKASNEGRALLDAPIDLVAGYASLDAYATWHLSELHNEVLSQTTLPEANLGGYATLNDYFWDLEVPFTKCLWRMERRGVTIDTVHLDSLRVPLEQKKEELLRDIMRLAQRPINPNSPQQLRSILFGSRADGGLGLKGKRWTKEGAESTDEPSLKPFVKTVPLVASIMEHRKVAKILGTYIKKLRAEVCSTTSRIHTSFRQAGTVTGRLSSANPNLQNVPSKGDIGKEIRAAFTADAGHTLIVADYSQMEMCIMAHVSGDAAMIGAISDGLDLHSFTASRMLGVEYEHVVIAKWMKDLPDTCACELLEAVDSFPEVDLDTLKEIARRRDDLVSARSAAKAIGFGLMYGRGPGALAEELDVSRKRARELIDQWFDTFPSVRTYIDDIQRQARERDDHAVHTVFGRPRRLTTITSTQHGVRAKAERDAINAPIQGSASCIIKRAMLMIDCDEELGGDCLEGGTAGIRLLLQVHDEIMLECPTTYTNEEQGEWTRKIQEIMARAADLRVPLRATGGVASNWADAK